MSCSKDPWILNRFMEYAITAVSSNFSETNIIVVVATSEVGRYIAKDFLMDNWVAVTERYGMDWLDALVPVLGRTVSTDQQVTELQHFFSTVLEEHQRVVVQAKLQAMKTKNLQNKKRIARVVEWLRKNT
ncbi:mCG141257 [Mus musculus]|nr:mCG141257 [Mus musculus]